MKVVLENLTKVFPSRDKKAGKEVVAVNDFTFEIPDGQLVGLLGPSGCGKSTTLYMISGLQKPTSGKIYFGDDDVTELSTENRGIGLVFQNYALYPHMTVMQNIMFPLQNLKGKDKLSKTEMIDRAYEAASLVQIDELMDRKPSELSGGQLQRQRDGALLPLRGKEFHLIVMLVMAIYAFTKITLASVNWVKSRKSTSAKLITLRNLSFADAFVSMFSLQRSMLVSFEGMTETEIRIMNVATGSAVCIIVFLLGLSLVRKK